jgi:aldehyde:ferredoxin oxidoreductase
MEQIKSLSYESTPIKNGYTDQILRVDLGSLDISISKLSPDFKNKYVGGRGYALKLIWDEVSENTHHDSPENVLVMASGPLGNEPRFPGSGKFIVGTISPLTDTFVDSNIGGHFAPLLKVAGFDALAVTGISEKEVVLVVDADSKNVQIIEAPVFDTDSNEGALSYAEALLKALNDGELSENLAAVSAGIGAVNTRFGIINSLFYDKRRNRLRSKQAGRGGTGTVMRHKGLKAVVVRCGNAKIGDNHPADEEGVKKAGADLKKVLSKSDPKQLRLKSWGTPVLVEFMDKYHILPVNNYQYGQHPDAKNVFAEIFLERYFTEKVPDGCYKGCNLACAKGAERITLKYGPRAGATVGIDGPEYETAGAVTCMGIFDPQFIMEYNWYCDEYGLDTISMGVTTSFLMECFQRGFLTKEDVGYDLLWGDKNGAVKLLSETAYATDFGKICSQGARRAKQWVAETYTARTGASLDDAMAQLNKFAMETKGLEFSMYISKESLAQQGGYGFALKGPQHDEAWLIFIDQVHKEIPTFQMKAEALKWFPLIRTWFNAVGLCKLPWIDVRHPAAADTENPAQNRPTLDYYVRYFNATTGSNKTLEGILEDSERLHLLQKLINLRHGKGTRESDRIPLRAMAPAFLNEYEARNEYYDEWIKEHANGRKIPEDQEARHALLIELRQEAYEKLCDVVYEAKGYTNNSIPLFETVEKMGLLDKQANALLKSFGVEKRRLAN